MLKKGDKVELEIESAAFEGFAVARHEDFVVFVRNAVPGDKVIARVVRRKRRHAEAVAEEILERSPQRVDPRCRYFGVCGGCRWQNLDYRAQLESKRTQVQDLFSRMAGLDFPEVQPPFPSPDIYDYRNKMEFTFGCSRWLTTEEIESGEQLNRDFALGLHIPKRFDRILDLEECHLQGARSPEIVNFTRHYALERAWSPYDTRNHFGYLRNLVIRNGQRTGDLLVNLVTSRAEPQRMKAFRDDFLEAFPETTTLINSVNDTRSPVAAGAESVLHGSGVIHDRIGKHVFRITPTSFFQPNTAQAERLFDLALSLADLKGDEVVYDLYCGVGAISLHFSDAAKTVLGFDSHPPAIADAQANAGANQVENCRFFAMDAKDVLVRNVFMDLGRPDVVVLDPPRSGLHPEVARALLDSSTPRILYISCNPATQARDLQVLRARYRIEAVQPVDMFPHTHHIENVVALGFNA